MVDNSTLNNYAEEFRFFDDCCQAIFARKYIEATLIMEKGLNENRDKIQAIDPSDFLQQFCERLIFLRGDQIKDPVEPTIKSLTAQDKSTRELGCSFCGKHKNHVRNLIAGPKTYICNECIEICNEIIDDENNPRAGSGVVGL